MANGTHTDALFERLLDLLGRKAGNEADAKGEGGEVRRERTKELEGGVTARPSRRRKRSRE